jgi:hypothetical protein
MSDDTPKKHLNLYKRVTASVPLLVTVVVHVVLIAIAGYFVVSEQIIGKKKTFEAVNATESVVQKQVEHRLQVARKGGGSASSSPVSASRIFSTAQGALQLPEMPDLPSVGASSLSGMGFGKGMGAVGTGTGYSTGIGSGNTLGGGFMPLSFLGTTSQRASKIVFIVDVGKGLLDIRKGGFEAFKIIREEIMKLVNRLPPSAAFNVVLYEGAKWNPNAVPAIAPTLLPATVANKQMFFEWMTPVNATPDTVGLASAKGHLVRWKARDVSSAGIDPNLNVPDWVDALHFALEMEPDTIYVISGGAGRATRKISESELAQRKRENDEYVADLKKDGLDIAAVTEARNRAYAKASAEFDAINAKLRAAGKTPLVIVNARRLFEKDFQDNLKRLGYSITLDPTGWITKSGKLIWSNGFTDYEYVDFEEVTLHVSKLQRALVKSSAALNYFLFVGPNENPKQEVESLSKLTSRNGGKFQLLTTRQLQELTARDAKK